MVIYNKIKIDIGRILRKQCEQKGMDIIESEAYPDYIYILIAILSQYSVAQVMGYLKGKSSQVSQGTVAVRKAAAQKNMQKNNSRTMKNPTVGVK